MECSFFFFLIFFKQHSVMLFKSILNNRGKLLNFTSICFLISNNPWQSSTPAANSKQNKHVTKWNLICRSLSLSLSLHGFDLLDIEAICSSKSNEWTLFKYNQEINIKDNTESDILLGGSHHSIPGVQDKFKYSFCWVFSSPTTTTPAFAYHHCRKLQLIQAFKVQSKK